MRGEHSAQFWQLSQCLGSPPHARGTLNDSILSDEETERERDRKDVAMGVMSLTEYRMKWYQEDEETAKANLPEQSSSVMP